MSGVIGVMRIGGRYLPRVWWLDWHYDPRGAGRTSVGQLVYRAKPYQPQPGSTWSTKQSDPAAVEQLARVMCRRGQVPPSGPLEVDAVMGVPAHEGKATLNLPDELARGIAECSGVAHRPDLVTKVRDTPEMKHLPEEDKPDALLGAFKGTGSGSVPARVLVVDDLVLTGHTVDAVAGALFSIGVARVVAYAASRVRRGMV